MARHADTEDFTLIAQDAMLDVMGNVMGVVTAAVGAIAGVSLLVGAVGILTMMWIAVGERKAEIGLMRAIGATRRQVAGVFLAESAALALAGGLLGVAAGLGLQALLRLLVPGLPLQVPYFYVVDRAGDQPGSPACCPGVVPAAPRRLARRRSNPADTNASPKNEVSMRRFKIPLILFFIFAGLFVVFRGAMKPKPIEVELATVDRGVVEETVTNSRAGTIKARRRAKLSPELGGVVAELPFREGQTATAGALLMRLEDSLQRAHLLVAERDLAAAEANLAQPCLEFERARRELEAGAWPGRRRHRLDRPARRGGSAAGFADAACTAGRTAVDRGRRRSPWPAPSSSKTVIRAPFLRGGRRPRHRNRRIRHAVAARGAGAGGDRPARPGLDLHIGADGRGRLGAHPAGPRGPAHASTRTAAASSPAACCGSRLSWSTARSRTARSRSRSSSPTPPSPPPCCRAPRPTSKRSSSPARQRDPGADALRDRRQAGPGACGPASWRR